MSSIQRSIRRNIERTGYTPKDKRLSKRISKAASRNGMTRAEYIAEQERNRKETNN